MRLIVLLVVNIFSASLINCSAAVSPREVKKATTDSTEIKLVAKFNLSTDKIFNSPGDYPISTILYKDSIFMLFYSSNRIVNVSTKDGRAKTYNVINNTIAKYAEKYSGLKGMIITDRYYYISYLNAIIMIDRRTFKTVIEIPNNSVIEHISVDSANTIMLFTSDDVTYYNDKGQKIFNIKSPRPLTSRFIDNQNGEVIIGNGLSLIVFNTYDKKFTDLIIPASSDIRFKQAYLGTVLNDKLFYFQYDSRNSIYKIDRNSAKVETVYNASILGLKPSEQAIQEEEGSPNLSVLPDQDNRALYVVSLKANILSIHKIW